MPTILIGSTTQIREASPGDLADLRVPVASDQHAARGTGRGMAIIHDTTLSPSKLELLTS
jgi:hypothetical protein